MVNKPFHELDGRFLYYTFLAGGNRVLEHQAEINLINVYARLDDGVDTISNLNCIKSPISCGRYGIVYLIKDNTYLIKILNINFN